MEVCIRVSIVEFGSPAKSPHTCGSRSDNQHKIVFSEDLDHAGRVGEDLCDCQILLITKLALLTVHRRNECAPKISMLSKGAMCRALG